MANNYDYLQDQVELLELPATCLFTKEEAEFFHLMSNKDTPEDKKKEYQDKLNKLIKIHKGPREINSKEIVNVHFLPDTDEFKDYYIDENGVRRFHYKSPEYVSYDWIKLDYRISEFCSELSRCAGIEIGGTFYDKIVIQWKSLDTMTQIVKNGFWFKYIDDKGNKCNRYYTFYTASAGNMRTNRFQMISADCKERVFNQLFNGLNDYVLNASGGVNISKLLAYRSLAGSATKRWKNPDGSKFSIRNCIVVKDYTCNLDILVDYIQSDKIVRGMSSDIVVDKDGNTGIDKNAADGCGIVLPGVLPGGVKNTILRGSWIKGLLCSFDFIKFCEVNKVPCVCEDYWGTKHDLIKENISVIMTESMFKMVSKYSSWEEYCSGFEKNDCWLCTMQAEAEDINDCDTRNNYQYVQSVLELTDDDIDWLLDKPMAEVDKITTNKYSMLSICGADINACDYKSKALALYPELIKGGDHRNTLKETRRSKIKQIQSSTFDWNAKRVFCIPDLYALCEYVFLNKKNPEGLIPAGKCVYKQAAGKKVAALRSPSLFVDGEVVECIKNTSEPAINNPYYWMNSNAIYVSSHDGLYLKANLDFDGDMLCVVEDTRFIAALERTIKKYGIEVPYYPGLKAPKQMVNPDMFVWAITTASKFNIGTISNSLTKLWGNKELVEAIKNNDVDTINRFMTAGKYLLLKNQGEIDGAKVGKSLELSKEARAVVESCIGSRKKPQKMPKFFQYTDNFQGQLREAIGKDNKKKKKEKCDKYNDCVCNRIMKKAEEHFKINKEFNFTSFGSFDYRNLLLDKTTISNDIKDKVIDIVNNKSNIKNFTQQNIDASALASFTGSLHDKVIVKLIKDELSNNNISDEDAYLSLVIYCYKEHFDTASYKRYFWLMFGEKAYNILRYNLKNKTYTTSEPDYTQKRCSICGVIISNKSCYCDKCFELQRNSSESKRINLKNKAACKKLKDKKNDIYSDTLKIVRECSTADEAIEKVFELKLTQRTATFEELSGMLKNIFGIEKEASALKVAFMRHKNKAAR